MNAADLLRQAEQADRTAEAMASGCSEYPRVGKFVHEQEAEALRNLAAVTEETADILKPVNRRERRQQDRAERLRFLAAKARLAAARAAVQSHRMMSVVPFGQPILVGHHSEKGHRRLLDRVHATDRRGYELGKQAEEYERRAQAAASNTNIYTDDPEAGDKLAARIAELEAEQARMKAINAAFRKGDAAMAKLGLSPETIAQLKARVEKAYSWEKQPYPGYHLTNNSANIRRLKERAARVAKLQAMPVRSRKIGSVTVQDNEEYQKVELGFPGKPTPEVIAWLKKHGFRWVRTAGVWSRGRDSATEMRLRWLAELLGEPLTDAE
jgi:hypothetical protein